MSKVLWQPSEDRIKNTNMYHFMQQVNKRYGKMFRNYNDLYHWSISEIPTFWEALWNYGKVLHSKSYDRVVDDDRKLPGAQWFEGAELNPRILDR